ncbi:MAG: hypothetical protein U9P14_08595 [Gemmatimonadota bacterium]|nr:hypothetical protein [Gemmatimonadota bacterium]
MKKNRLTIIFVKDTSRPFTLEISIKLIIFMVVLFIGFCATYFFFVRGYRSLNVNNVELEAKIHSLKYKISNLESEAGRLVKKKTQTMQEIEQAPEEVITAEAVEEVKKTEKDVAVLDLEVNARLPGRKLRYSFLLSNRTEDNRTRRGYTFMVLRKTKGRQAIRSYPTVELKDGLPTDYHLGIPFAIKRFKKYSETVDMLEGADILEVLVFSDTGELMLRIKRDI